MRSLDSFFFFFLNFFLTDGKLQYCVGFCHTSTCISHRYTHVLYLWSLPPIPHSITPLWMRSQPDVTELRFEISESQGRDQKEGKYCINEGTRPNKLLCRNSQDQISKEETGKPPEKKFRAMIVKMIQNLKNRMDSFIIGKSHVYHLNHF